MALMWANPDASSNTSLETLVICVGDVLRSAGSIDSPLSCRTPFRVQFITVAKSAHVLHVALLAGTESPIVSLTFPQRGSIRTAAIVRVQELDRIVLPETYRADFVRTWERRECPMSATRAGERRLVIRVHRCSKLIRVSREQVDLLQPRIDRLALQREDAEHALVNASERLSLDEALESFDAQRELAQRQRSLPRQAAFAQPLEVLGQRVLRPVDDPQILAAAALDRRLQQAT